MEIIDLECVIKRSVTVSNDNQLNKYSTTATRPDKIIFIRRRF